MKHETKGQYGMTKSTPSRPQTAPNGPGQTTKAYSTRDALRAAKVRSGLSYQKMADLLGVSKGVLYYLLKHGVEPRDNEIRRRLNLAAESLTGEPKEMIIQFVQRDPQGRFT